MEYTQPPNPFQLLFCINLVWLSQLQKNWNWVSKSYDTVHSCVPSTTVSKTDKILNTILKINVCIFIDISNLNLCSL